MIQFFLIFSFAAHIEAVPYPGSEEGIIGINNNNEPTNYKPCKYLQPSQNSPKFFLVFSCFFVSKWSVIDSFLLFWTPASSYKCTSGSLAPNPDDCGSFLICVHEKYLTGKCSTGLHFDSKINACNYPDAAKCSVNSGQGSSAIDTYRPITATSIKTTTTTTTTTTPTPTTTKTSKFKLYIILYF